MNARSIARTVLVVVMALSAVGFWIRAGLDAVATAQGVNSWSLKLTWDRYDAEFEANRHGRAVLLGDPHDLSDQPPPFVPAPDVTPSPQPAPRP